MRLLAAVEYRVQVQEDLVVRGCELVRRVAVSTQQRLTEEDNPAEIPREVDIAYREGIDIGEEG